MIIVDQISPIRREIYRSAIYEIDAATLTFSVEQLRLQRTLKVYDANPKCLHAAIEADIAASYKLIFDIIIPNLPDLTGLRRIRFGDPPGLKMYYATWAININPPNRAAQVEYTTTRYLMLSSTCEPPTNTILLSGDDAYTIRHRYNLELIGTGDILSEEQCSRWRDSLRDSSYFDGLADQISLGYLPVSFGDLESLYKRQILLGPERLSSISAGCLRSWRVSEFESFA